MIHRHIARLNVIDANFPVQVASSTVARASLDTDKVARLQLLACGHADFGQVSKIHIVGSHADPDHNTLAEAFLRECRAFPAGTNNRAINRAIDVLVANTYQIIPLVVRSIRPQVAIRL